MRVGWHGVLQSVADTVKLLLKENIIPAGADKLVWWLAPFFAVVPSVMAFVVIPFREKSNCKGFECRHLVHHGNIFRMRTRNFYGWLGVE